MAFLMHFQPGTPLEENGHNSFGIQSAYAHTLSDTFNITTGIDIDYTKGYLKQTQEQAFSSLNFPIGKHYDYDVDILTTALFLQTDNRFLEKGLVTAGVRFENARYEYNNHLSDGKACLPAATNCRYSRPADDTLNFYNWSPKLSVSYEAWENNTFYTTLAEAYRAPETSELFRLEQNQQLANIDSEQMDSVELGLKGALFSRVTYQLSAYYMQKSNVIFKDSNRQNVDNQKTKHQGLEASINTLLTNQLLLSTQLSYGKHQYDSNVFLFGGNNSFIKNNIIDTAPRHLHNITLTWFATDAAQLDIEGVYVGKYYLDSDNLYSYEGHTLTNLRFKYTLPQQWQVGLGITNITNEDYADRADVTVKTFSSPTPEERYFIGEPRSFRASVSKTF
jgi:outer membrane receptor protein involved in Fe transport